VKLKNEEAHDKDSDTCEKPAPAKCPFHDSILS
jgi:hypothetical protein